MVSQTSNISDLWKTVAVCLTMAHLQKDLRRCRSAPYSAGWDICRRRRKFSKSDLCNVVVLIPIELAAVLACLSFNQYTPQHLVLQVQLSIQDALHDSTFRFSWRGSSLPTGASSLNSCTWLMCFERTWRQRFEEFLATFASSSSSWFIWFGVINLSFAGYRWTATYTNQ